MPAGGSADRSTYPSVSSWELVLGALATLYPDTLFCLVGKRRRDDRTSTNITRDELDRLLLACGAAVDCFDRSLIDQLAIVESCDLFLSPHTGFGMAALAVGTPWLTIAGGHWPEYFFNGVPFYSVLPDPKRYPCYTGLHPLPPAVEDDDGEGLRTPSMSKSRIHEDLPELLAAARLLIEQRIPYESAIATHFERLLAFHRGDPSRIFSLDNIHEQFV
jgi:hypothetical protein